MVGVDVGRNADGLDRAGTIEHYDGVAGRDDAVGAVRGLW
jgi:hypothetical protein